MIYSRKFVLLGLLVLLGVSLPMAQAEESSASVFQNAEAYFIRNKEDIDMLTQVDDKSFLVFYFKASSLKSREASKILSALTPKLKTLVNLLYIDCENITPLDYGLCNSSTQLGDTFPRFELLVAPETKLNFISKRLNPHEKIDFEYKSVNNKTINAFVSKNIPFFGIAIDEDNIDSFFSNDIYNKVLLFTDKKETPTLYKAFSTIFYDTLYLGEIKSSETELVNRFNITEFPSVIIYKNVENDFPMEDFEIIPYKGQFKASLLEEFLNQYALSTKRYITLVTETNEQISNLDKFNLKLLNKYSYENDFNRFKNKSILAYLSKNEEKIDEKIKQVLYDSYGMLHMVRFNCDDETDFCKDDFGISNAPVFKLFPAGELSERLSKAISIPYSTDEILIENLKKEFPSENIELVNENSLNYKLAEYKKEDAIILIDFNKENTMNLPFYFISSKAEYKNKVRFFHFPNTPSDIIFDFKAYQFPQIMAIYWDKELIQKKLNVDPKSFYMTLNNVINHLLDVKNKEKVSFLMRKVYKDQVKDEAMFAEKCLSEKQEECIIAFLDARENKNSQVITSAAYYSLNYAMSFIEENKKINIVWIDNSCKNQLIKKFGLEKYGNQPIVVTLYHQSKQYTVYNGEFNVDSLFSLIERIVGKREELLQYEGKIAHPSNFMCIEEVKPELSSESDKKPDL